MKDAFGHRLEVGCSVIYSRRITPYGLVYMRGVVTALAPAKPINRVVVCIQETSHPEIEPHSMTVYAQYVVRV